LQRKSRIIDNINVRTEKLKKMNSKFTSVEFSVCRNATTEYWTTGTTGGYWIHEKIISKRQGHAKQ
jgi:hypothetical protein